MAATHQEHWTPALFPRCPWAASGARRATERLSEIEGFLAELQGDLDDRPSTLVRALEGYRRTLGTGG